MDLSNLPPTYVIPGRLELDELHRIEESIPTLTYDVLEAELFLGKIVKRERALFELRRLKVPTEPLCQNARLDIRVDKEHAAAEEQDHYQHFSPKRRKLSIQPRTQREQHSPQDTIKVAKLSWWTDSQKQNKLLDLSDYLLYEGSRQLTKIITSNNESLKPPSPQKDPASNVLTRAAADQDVGVGGSKPHARAAGRHPRIPRPPTLQHQTTSENSEGLPEIPPYLHTIYSCQRPTPFTTPNDAFLDELKKVRTLRQLQGDTVGVRAYSTSIATLSAYPHKLKTSLGKMKRLLTLLCSTRASFHCG